MKVVILAGGYGTRLGERTQFIPKPMVRIGGKPIIWHVMKYYASHGFNEFVICLGYKGDVIKEYFLNYEFQNSDFTISLGSKKIDLHKKNDEVNWKVTLVDTGLETLKGGRLKRIEKYLDSDTNLLTYGDGLSDINITKSVDQHNDSGKIITISGVHPPSRFGEVEFEGDVLTAFTEKSQTSSGFINGGFMIFNKKLLSYLTTDVKCDLEFGVLEDLSLKGEVGIYRHDGNWACMDNQRDVDYLNNLFSSGKAFWVK